jgi:hypothetical protein
MKNISPSFSKTNWINLRLLGLLVLLLASVSLSAQTQPYKSSVGLKLGYPNLLAYKTFLGESSSALELSVGARRYSSRNSWIVIGAGYLLHKDFDNLLPSMSFTESENIFIYFGAGASVYLWSYRFASDLNEFGSTSLGVQAYLGAEYRFVDLPLAIGLEYAPTFALRNTYYGRLGWGYGTLTVRYLLK